MSVTNKSVIFLLLTFAISWAFAVAGWALGAQREALTAGAVALFLMMTGPAIAALACAIAFEKGRRIEALGPRFKPNWWWLGAWVIGLALTGLSVAVTVLLSDRTLIAPLVGLRALLESMGYEMSQREALPAFMNYVLVAQAVFLGAAMNSVLTLTEELGWRGYLHHLWRPSGFWRTSLATGAIWGVWHAPAILLYGHNYPDHRVLGVALFTLWCVLAAPLYTLVRDRGGAVWAAGILHGTVNAVGGITIIVLSDPSFPWPGVVGIGGFVALTLGVMIVFLLQRRASAPAMATT